MIYICIDTMAFLAHPAGQTTQAKKDFVAWIDTYVKTEAGQPNEYRGIDVYAARCAPLHALSPAAVCVSAEDETRPDLSAPTLLRWHRPSARAMFSAMALRSSREAASPSAPESPTGGTQSIERAGRRRWASIVVAVIAVLGVSGAAAYWLIGEGRKPTVETATPSTPPKPSAPTPAAPGQPPSRLVVGLPPISAPPPEPVPPGPASQPRPSPAPQANPAPKPTGRR